MRFSIRDLLWLMAVVALAATVYTEGVQMRRQAAKWAAEKAKLEQDAAVALAAMRARADGLRQQNALLQHQLVVQLEKARQQDEAEQRERAAAALSRFRKPQSAAPSVSLPDEAER